MPSNIYEIPKASAIKTKTPDACTTWNVVAVIALLLSVVAIVIGLINIVTISTRSTPTSCKDIKSTENGLYVIQPDSSLPKFVVYCDMKSAGGGWTLVAALHENNIYGKCTKGDKWSSEQGSTLFSRAGRRANYSGSQNWENFNVFGEISDVTYDDYKNPAYYAMKASNVMVWHVPNKTPLSDISDRGFLKYYTSNNFLSQYGSTLQSLFLNQVPLQHAGSYRYFKLIAPPVNYLLGNHSYVVSKIPALQRPHVEPGYLQFRAFDEKGFANALCPAIKMTRGDSTRVCVGGGRSRDSTVCGDFAGWATDSDEILSLNLPTNSSRALEDIFSSLLIFTK